MRFAKSGFSIAMTFLSNGFWRFCFSLNQNFKSYSYSCEIRRFLVYVSRGKKPRAISIELWLPTPISFSLPCNQEKLLITQTVFTLTSLGGSSSLSNFYPLPAAVVQWSGGRAGVEQASMGQCPDREDLLGLPAGEVLGRPSSSQDPKEVDKDQGEEAESGDLEGLPL